MTAQDPVRWSNCPDLFLLGVPKAATTALASALVASGACSYGRSKEPGILGNFDYSDATVERLYADHYGSDSAARGVRLDATPWAIYDDRIPGRIDRLRSGSPWRSVVCLRQPWDRMKSMYVDQTTRGRERRTFTEAIRAEVRSVRTGRSGLPLSLRYIETSLYGQWLTRWKSACEPRNHPKLIFFEQVTEVAEFRQMSPVMETELGIPVGELTLQNVRGTATVPYARWLDRGAAAGRKLHPVVRAPLRRAAVAATGRIAASRRPVRRASLPSTVMEDLELFREVSELFRKDRVLLLAAGEESILPQGRFPDWMRRDDWLETP